VRTGRIQTWIQLEHVGILLKVRVVSEGIEETSRLHGRG
jgi:hypothetical protein